MYVKSRHLKVKYILLSFIFQFLKKDGAKLRLNTVRKSRSLNYLVESNYQLEVA